MIDQGQWREFGQDTGVTPLLFTRSVMGFLLTTKNHYFGLTSHQIKSLLLPHHHSTSALVSEILTSVLQTVQKKTIYIWTVRIYRLTEDNVQNTHTYTPYTQCTIKTYLVIDTHYTPYVLIRKTAEKLAVLKS